MYTVATIMNKLLSEIFSFQTTCNYIILLADANYVCWLM